MFNTARNNQGNRTSINTSSMRSYSDASLLTVRWWNQQLSISIAPAVGKDANGLTQYESEMTRMTTTSISPRNARALMEGITKELLPAISERRAAAVAVPVGSDSTRKVVGLEYDGNESSLVIYTNLNEDNSANNIIRHPFAKSLYVRGYNPTTGKYDGEETVESELMEFISRIDHVSMLDGATAHAIKYESAFRSAAQNNNGNNGYGQSNNYGGYNNNAGLPFDPSGNGAGMSTPYQAPSSTFSGNDLPFMPLG